MVLRTVAVTHMHQMTKLHATLPDHLPRRILFSLIVFVLVSVQGDDVNHEPDVPSTSLQSYRQRQKRTTVGSNCIRVIHSEPYCGTRARIPETGFGHDTNVVWDTVL